MIWLCIIFGWIICGLINGFRVYHHFQTQWPTLALQFRKSDRQFAIFIGFFGPVGLIGFLVYIIVNKLFLN